MNRKTFLQSSKRGSVLALAIIVIVLLFTAGLGMLQLGLQARVFATRTSNAIAAQTAADAGLTNAIWTLNQNVQADYSNNDLPAQTDQSLANCSADFSYEVAIYDNSGAQPGGAEESEEEAGIGSLPVTTRYTIKCVGSSGNAQRTVYATVKLQGLFEYAILAQGDISLMPNTLVSGFNSSDPDDTDVDVKIGTTSIEADSIPLGPGTVVEGDVFVGVGGDPSEVIGEGGTITGQTFALTEEISFPVITVPALPYIGTTISAKGSTVTFGPDDSGTYKEIKLSSQSGDPGVLEIVGGKVLLHIEDDIDLGNSAEIIIRPDSWLVLYVDGDITMGNSAGFVNENTPVSTLKIFATGDGDQTFELKAKSSVFGVVYAPDADVELYPKTDLYGAIVANNISIKSGGAFYYDEALRDVSPDDEGARFVIEKWWE